ncbi:hypothetical protein F5B19DRAFT_470690 [Rostrohypoxylon terebratum]|nr:hypothetical protein F5B19DRAFT_470690 [Rostrohypoxylon terebratum]
MPPTYVLSHRYIHANKRKADEVCTLNYDDEGTVDAPMGPRPKRIKADHAESGNRRWDLSMGIPRGRPQFLEVCTLGNSTIDDPEIVWIGDVPGDVEAKEMNEYVARKAALKLNIITHVYIIYGARSHMFVDRDGKRVNAWHSNDMNFQHQEFAADPHMCLAFGTGPDHVNVYGYVNVIVDENGNPMDFATTRNADHVVDGDDRIFELFEYNPDQGDCSAYCPTHAEGEKAVHHCDLAKRRFCPHHNTNDLIDHFCRRTRWRAESFDDHYCPCSHDLNGVLDHYCPCIHEKRRMTTYHCTHHIPRKTPHTHYCPLYSF